MKAHQTSVGKSDEWLTPQWILEPLGVFDLDPCASVVRPWATAKQHLTVEDDGLKANWGGAGSTNLAQSSLQSLPARAVDGAHG